MTYTAAMLVIIDNYDSFTYNLVQRFGEINPKLAMKVYRNDEVTIDQLQDDRPTHIVVSPGPCTPREGGISNDVVTAFAGQIPVLGVCLGHQCIGFSYGMTVNRNDRLMHGKVSRIHHDGKTIYAGAQNPFDATRYHSLIVRRETVHPDFIVTSWTDEDEIMGLRHRTWPLEGVQFHPESFLTTEGYTLLGNFLKM